MKAGQEVEQEQQAGNQKEEEEEEEEGNCPGCNAPALHTSLCWDWD